MTEIEGGIVRPHFDNLPFVKNDQEESIKAAGFIKADDFGEDNEYILNKNPATDNISSA